MALKSKQEADLRKNEQEQLMATHQWVKDQERLAHEREMAEDAEKRRQHERDMTDKQYREDTDKRKHERDILAMQQKHASREAEKQRKHEREEAEKKRKHEVDQSVRRIEELKLQKEILQLEITKTQGAYAMTRTKFGNGNVTMWNRARDFEFEDSDVDEFKG